MMTMDKCEAIKKILMDELCSIYCYNCKFKNIEEDDAITKYDYYACDECHRKHMGWELSEDYAERIAKSILEACSDESVERSDL